MVLQRYPSVSRGRAMRQAANVGMQAGHDILKSGMEAQYSQQQAEVKALDTGFMADLDKELWNNRGDVSQWGKILEDKYKKYVQERSKNVTNPRLKKEMLANQRLEKAVLDKYVQEEAQKQSIINNENALKTMDLSVSQYSYNNITVMQKSQVDYLKSYGEIAKVLNISEDEQIEHVDKVWSKAVERFLISSGNEEWINNPNKFAEDNNLNGEIGRPLFTDEEVAGLKRDYKARKQLNEYEIRAAQEKKESETLDNAFDFAEKGDFRSGIDTIKKARTELGTESFIDALNKYQNAFRILNDTGTNVYKETQNWELYWDDYKKAIDKEITEKELRNHVGADGYSVVQFKEIKGILDGTSSKAKAFEDTKAAKDLVEMVDYNFGLIEGTLEQKKYLRDKGLKLLKDTITEDMDAKDKLVEAIRISRELDREHKSGLISEQLEKALTKPLNQSLGSTTGLGDIWEQLDDDSKRGALRLLSKGERPEDIIAFFKKKTGK